MIRDADTKIPIEGKAQWIEDLVTTNTIDNWETQNEPEHLRTISDRLLSLGNSTIPTLKQYCRILEQGEIAHLNSPEHIKSGLIVKREKMLRIANRIYATVFDRNWLNKTIGQINS